MNRSEGLAYPQRKAYQNTMRVLFIVPYVPNLIRVRPFNLIRCLADRGHDVTVLTLWSDQEEREDAVKLRSLLRHSQSLLGHYQPPQPV